MLILGKSQGRGGRGRLSASQVCGSSLSPPQKHVSGLSSGLGREIPRLEGLRWGFLCCPTSRGHRPSDTASAQGPRSWPGAHGCRGEWGAAGLREVPPTPGFEAALLPALAAMPALGVSLLFLAPRLASDTKPRYFCRAASGPNPSRLSNTAKKNLIWGFFAPNLPALDLQSALLQPKVWGYRGTPFLRTQVKRNLCQLLGG